MLGGMGVPACGRASFLFGWEEMIIGTASLSELEAIVRIYAISAYHISNISLHLKSYLNGLHVLGGQEITD